MSKGKHRADGFSKAVVESLAKQVAYLCSNPACNTQTLGPSAKDSGSTNVGIAAHICAASPGGPRYDPNQSQEERRSAENGIWVCNNCSRRIDSDERSYSKTLLLEWKKTAVAAASRQIGHKVLNEADVDARLASAFKTLPSQQSRFAVSNVHRATQTYLDSLDSRLEVKTTFDGKAPSYHISAKEDVPLNMSWTAVEHEKATRDFQASLENGTSLTLDLTSLNVTGSPLFEHLISPGTPAKLEISSPPTPVTVKLFAPTKSSIYRELAMGDGQVTFGTRRANLAAELFHGLISIHTSSLRVASGGESSDAKFSFNYDRWAGTDIRFLKDFESAAKLVEEAAESTEILLETYINGKTIRQHMPLEELRNYLVLNLLRLNYVVMARKVAQAFSFSVPFDIKYSMTHENYRAISEVVDVLEGRRTKENIIGESIALSATITVATDFETERVSVDTDHIVGEPERLNLFGRDFELPQVIVGIKGNGTLKRVGRYEVGDVLEITMGMSDVHELTFAFDQTVGGDSPRRMPPGQAVFLRSTEDPIGNP